MTLSVFRGVYPLLLEKPITSSTSTDNGATVYGGVMYTFYSSFNTRAL